MKIATSMSIRFQAMTHVTGTISARNIQSSSVWSANHQILRTTCWLMFIQRAQATNTRTFLRWKNLLLWRDQDTLCSIKRPISSLLVNRCRLILTLETGSTCPISWTSIQQLPIAIFWVEPLRDKSKLTFQKLIKVIRRAAPFSKWEEEFTLRHTSPMQESIHTRPTDSLTETGTKSPWSTALLTLSLNRFSHI